MRRILEPERLTRQGVYASIPCSRALIMAYASNTRTTGYVHCLSPGEKTHKAEPEGYGTRPYGVYREMLGSV